MNDLTQTPATSERDEIKNRIAAAQERNQTRGSASELLDSAGKKAGEVKDKAVAFAKEHPVATVAGGIAVGVLVASMFRAPRKAAARTGMKAAGLAAIGSEIALAMAGQFLDQAGSAGCAGAQKLGDVSDHLGDSARAVRRRAGFIAGNASDNARITAREAGKSVRRALKK